MNFKQIVAPAIIASMAFGTFASASAGADKGAKQAPQKVSICHGGDDGDAELITVSVHATYAHAMHGDGVPGGKVYGQDGYIYGDDCSPVSVPAGLAAGCYDSIFFYDMKFNGQAKKANNTVFTNSYDGSCSGAPGSPITLVEAEDAQSAIPSCSAAGAPSNTALNVVNFGFSSLPATAWICQ